MPLYVLCDLGVRVDADAPLHGLGLTALLHDLSFAQVAHADIPEAPLVLSVRRTDGPAPVPHEPQTRVEWDGLTVYRSGEETYVSDGSSVLHLRPSQARGEAWLAPAFLQQPLVRRQRFWGYGLVKLLRTRGAYALHAAGVRAPCGRTILLIGPTGSGKSTLAVGLVRHGWGYLSDDAVLLRRRGDHVHAIAFRRAFSVYRRQRKCRIDVHAEHPGRHVAVAPPQLLVFPHIVPRARSRMRRLAASDAMGRLLREGGPELYDRDTMGAHLGLLASLLQQAPAYALCAGRDLYTRPTRLLHAIRRADGTGHGPHRP